jgi:hypothetical protein
MLQTLARCQDGVTAVIQAVKMKFLRSIKESSVLRNVNKAFKVNFVTAYSLFTDISSFKSSGAKVNV